MANHWSECAASTTPSSPIGGGGAQRRAGPQAREPLARAAQHPELHCASLVQRAAHTGAPVSGSATQVDPEQHEAPEQPWPGWAHVLGAPASGPWPLLASTDGTGASGLPPTSGWPCDGGESRIAVDASRTVAGHKEAFAHLPLETQQPDSHCPSEVQGEAQTR